MTSKEEGGKAPIFKYLFTRYTRPSILELWQSDSLPLFRQAELRFPGICREREREESLAQSKIRLFVTTVGSTPAH